MFDWNDLRYVLAVHSKGSLSGAARALRVHQTTVGRRLEAIEHALGTPLFLRTVRGLVPAAGAAELLGPLTEMAGMLERLEARTLGEERPEAPVRVACTETMAHTITQRALPKLDLVVELVIGNLAADLSRGEVDLAVRLVPSDDADLVRRRIGLVRHGLYASEAYLEHAGKPRESLDGHRILVPSRELRGGPEARWLLAHRGTAQVALEANSHVIIARACESGLGLAVLPHAVAAGAKVLLVRTLDEIEPRPFYLVQHRDSRRSPRVKRVAEAIEAAFSDAR